MESKKTEQKTEVEAPKAKAKAHKVGDVVKVPKGETIMVRPDGTAVTVRRAFVLDTPGTFTCGPLSVTAK